MTYHSKSKNYYTVWWLCSCVLHGFRGSVISADTTGITSWGLCSYICRDKDKKRPRDHRVPALLPARVLRKINSRAREVFQRRAESFSKGSAKSDLRTIRMLQISPITCQVRCLEGIQKLRRRDGEWNRQRRNTTMSAGSTYMYLFCNKVSSEAFFFLFFVSMKCVSVCAFPQSGSVRLPTGRCDSLHSNYGSAPFLRST